MRILFCKIGWMKYYKGVSEKDPIYNGGAFVRENGNGGEAYNFEAVSTEADGVNCYGFFETKFKNGYKSANRVNNQLHIERIDACAKNLNELDDVLVVWCATKERNEYKVVGWYQHAWVYRFYQVLQFENGYIQDFNVKAKKEDCVLLPYEEQNRVQWNAPISKVRGYGFGQSLVWYASEADAAPAVSYVQNLVDAIHAYSGKNYLDIDETNDPALQQWNACR